MSISEDLSMETCAQTIAEQLNSDDENEMNLLNRTKAKSRPKILDSDSEPDDTATRNNPNLGSEQLLYTAEAESQNKILDSDSETVDSVTINNTKFGNKNADEGSSNKMYAETQLQHVTALDSNSSGHGTESRVDKEKSETEPNVTTFAQAPPTKKSYLSSLCDPESSDEDESQTNGHSDLNLNEPVLIPKIYKPPRKPKNKERPKMMTGKEAAKQRAEITSDSQRRLRQTNVSLPYHKPKTYSFKEFFEKRSKLASILPSLPQASASVAIKMTKDQLEEVSRKLDERIKEVEEFYRSDDDDDNNENLKENITSLPSFTVGGVGDGVETNQSEPTDNQQETTSEVVIEQQSEQQCDVEDAHDKGPTLKPKIADLLEDQVLHIQPKLSGTAGDIIDLDQGIAKPSAVKKFVEKFLQHAAQKTPHKHQVSMEIIEVGGHGEIIKETVSMNVEEEEEPVMVETPGAKLRLLREELQAQMAQKRLEMWKQKQDQGDCFVPRNKEDSNAESEKDILDDEDEEEYEMSESESDGTVEDEDDCVVKDKSRVKSAFVDDEADEDDEMDVDRDDYDNDMDDNEDDMNDNTHNVDDDDHSVGRNEVVNEETHQELDGVENGTEETFQSPKRKVLRRIIRPFNEDSDNDDDTKEAPPTVQIVKYYTSSEDDVLPPNLPNATSKTPLRTQMDKNKSEFEFLTPVTYLTGLNNLSSSSKYSNKSPISPLRAPSNSSPNIQKNLFPESGGLDDESEENIEDVEKSSADVRSEEQPVEESLPTTQDLLNVCSGDFSTFPEGTGEKIVIQASPRKEIKNLDHDQEQIISQLLDEDELERFKKKFESPMVGRTQVVEDCDEANATGLINSDDENEELEIIKKKGQKKLVFSDDEDDGEEADTDSIDDETEDVDEDIDLHDEDDEEQILENELKTQESANFKLADFVDAEAELSESEWGSADEDEKDLDVLDTEEGDLEKFNENKIRSELERIHMRQVLDDDNREVKLLQELLLEDGELNGTGRKRHFRWKSLNGEDNGEFDKRGDDDIFLDEEESEEQWRKMRHKREMFLKKKSETAPADEDNMLTDCDILKVRQIFTNKSFGSQDNPPLGKIEKSDVPFGLLSKRGSFLSRNDQVLQRLAEYNKVDTTKVTSSTKNSKCFVFQTVETTESVLVKGHNNKRKTSETTPNVVKKLRLSELSPATGKLAGKSERAKKLFGAS